VRKCEINQTQFHLLFHMGIKLGLSIWEQYREHIFKDKSMSKILRTNRHEVNG